MQRTKTRALAVCAMMTALSLVLLYAACLAPTGRLALLAIAALLPAGAVLTGGIPWGLLTWAATSLLALILLPDLRFSLVWTVLLGHYSVIKSLIERLQRPVPEWILKLAVWNLLLAAVYGLFRLLGLELNFQWGLAVMAAAANGIYVIYDVAATRLLTDLSRRIRFQDRSGHT